VPLGVVLAATDPVALDLVAVRLMGFDEQRIPKVWEPIHHAGLRVTAVTDPSDVEVGEVAADFEPKKLSLDRIRAERCFVAHAGWVGHIERERLA
jgi:uncharacterized protein (DUF362 family)